MSENSAQPKSKVIPVQAAAEEKQDSLYEVRQKVYMRSVSGAFATWRWILVWATQILFYGLPWLQ